MLNIDQFNAKMNEAGGPVKSSKFVMRIVPKGGSWLAASGADQASNLMFFIDSVNLPGVNHIFSDIRRFGYGPLERRPLNQIFSELTCTVILDRKGNNLGLFNRWMDFIIGVEPLMYETKNEMIDQFTGGNGYTYEVAYPYSYQADIDIFVLDEYVKYGGQVDPERNCVVHYRIYDAYPSNIGDMDLNWNNNDTIARFPMTFQYKFFKAEQHSVSTGASGALSAGTTTDSGLPNVGVDISIGPGGISGGVNVLGENGSVRVGTDGVTGTLRSGIGDVTLNPGGRVTSQVNVPIGVTINDIIQGLDQQ